MSAKARGQEAAEAAERKSEELSRAVARGGPLDRMEELWREGARPNELTVAVAARRGSEQALRWCLERLEEPKSAGQKQLRQMALWSGLIDGAIESGPGKAEAMLSALGLPRELGAKERQDAFGALAKGAKKGSEAVFERLLDALPGMTEKEAKARAPRGLDYLAEAACGGEAWRVRAIASRPAHWDLVGAERAGAALVEALRERPAAAESAEGGLGAVMALAGKASGSPAAMEQALVSAAIYGRLAALRWLLENAAEGLDPKRVKRAIKRARESDSMEGAQAMEGWLRARAERAALMEAAGPGAEGLEPRRRM